jgi:sugar phosphate isomerase/epimerase
MRVFHVNDFPKQPPAEELKDADRVYPGDGAAPWESLLADLRSIFFNGWFSVELFNPAYAKLPPDQVARTARDKMAALLPPM